ncbi:MAG: OprD family outer membrane porin [Gammaproteobacteria bacterium]
MDHIRSRRIALMAPVVFCLVSQQSQSAEYIRAQEPAPASVVEVQSVMKRAFTGTQVDVGWPHPRVDEWLKDRTPFVRDTRFGIKPRTYYLDQKNLDGSKNEAWALGGSLYYVSGQWKELFSVSAELFTSQKLYGPETRDGSELLKPGQDGFTVLGTAYVQLQHKEFLARLYRQRLNIPYVNGDDDSMVANTFEAYDARYLGRRLGISVGYIDKMKTKSSDTFQSMSEVAGVPGSDKGVATVGAIVAPTDNLIGGAVNFYGFDLFNTFFTQAHFTSVITDQLEFELSGQFTDQRSVGDALLGSFDTQNGGARAALGYKGAILSVAFNTTSNGAAIRSPWGGYPGFASQIVRDFDRAGEDAWLVGMSYHFKQQALKGLSVFGSFARGTGARDATTHIALPDESEFNMTLDYLPPKEVLRGLWFRVRGLIVDQEGVDDLTTGIRVIVNYRYGFL